MPVTLMDAISQGNLAQVQEILAHRNANGEPIADINHGFGGAGTALIWAVWTSPINLQIIQSIINVRDNLNNPVIDINHLGPHKLTVFSWVLSRNIEPPIRRQLLQMFLDVRKANGDLLADVSQDNSNVTLLKSAQQLDDTYSFRILQDARLADGNYALDINEISHGSTVLDTALVDGIFYRVSQAMVNTIRELGGISAYDMSHEQRMDKIQARMQAVTLGSARYQEQLQEQIRFRREQERLQALWLPNNPQPVLRVNPVAITIPPQPVVAENQINQFNANNQNTHDPSVTQTAKGSLISLHTRYANKINVCDNHAINAIEQLIQNFDYKTLVIDKRYSASEKKKLAQSFFNLLKTRLTTVHSYTNLTIDTIIALVWEGIIDKDSTVYPEDIRVTFEPTEPSAPDYLITTKKASLVEKFIEAALVYKGEGSNVDICSGGSIHKLLESLNKAHVDVVIVTGQQAIGSAANDMAVALVGVELMKKNENNRADILSNWVKENHNSSDFKKSMVSIIATKLKEHFDILLTDAQINAITENVEYLPRPRLPDEKLNALADEIENTVIKQGTLERKSAVDKLHEQVRNIYYEQDSQKTKHERLLALYENFKKVDALVQQVMALSESTQNVAKNKIIVNLKSQVDGLYRETDSSGLLAKIENQIQSLELLEKFGQQINQIKANYPGKSTKRLESIEKLSSVLEDDYSSLSLDKINKILIDHISAIYDTVREDHKIHGKLRILGHFQPESRLLSLINNQRNQNLINEKDYKEAFFKEHNLLYRSDRAGFFGNYRATKICDNWNLDKIIKHASESNNRSRQVCINLGWLDKHGKLRDSAPEKVKEVLSTKTEASSSSTKYSTLTVSLQYC